MNNKRLAVWLLAAAVSFTLLACGIGSVPFISQAQPTATKRATRPSRPTFTPRPADTDTPEPSPTEEPTEEPTQEPPTPVPVTQAPTRRPTARPAAPTQPPAPQPTAPPAATTNPFKYSFFPASCNTDDPAICNVQNGVKCEHSGGHHVDVLVYANFKDPGSALAGVKVRYSFSPGGPLIDPDEVTDGGGKASKTFSTVTDSPKKGIVTYYVWLIDNSGNPISPYSPPIPINDKKEDQPDTCWVGTVAFAGGK